MNDKKKSERHFKKFQAEAIFVKDIETFIKEYKTSVPNVKLSKKTKLKSLVKVINKFVNDI